MGALKFVISKTDQKGSILIGIIAAMVLFAALGTAILSLTSTATMSQVMANSTARAYYLAESGFRYIQGLYSGMGSENAMDSMLESLHGRTFTLKNNEGSFYLDVYPYYLKVTEDPYGTNLLQTKAPGGLPPGFSPTQGYLKIGSGYYFYSSTSGISDPNINFTITSLLPHFPVGTDVFYVAETNNAQTVALDGSIDLGDDTAGEFPLRNGLIEINGHIYSYKEFDLTGYRLTGIRDPRSNEMEPLTFGAHEKIVLQKFTKIESTGTFGAGDHQSARKVVYSVPLPIKWQGEKVEFHETFDDGSSRWNQVLGSHEVQNIDPGNALKVTDTGLVGTSDSGSLAVFEWLETVIDLESSNKHAGTYLSYDAQVKIGFDTEVPNTYMAGISFRITGEGADPDSYGISFVKSEVGDGIPVDLVPSALIFPDDMPAIVLWQKTDDVRTWLAYKNLGAVSDFDPDNATILVRIIEAASIKFTAGGPVPVNPGDIITQSSYTKGKVVGYPILAAGSWEGGDASGIILLNNVIGTFTSGEIIDVVGSATTATVDTNGYSERNNYIRAYYGTESGGTSGTLGYHLDDIRLEYPRNADIQWPPENAEGWTAENDYFTLVKWNGYQDISIEDRLDSETMIRSGSLTTDSFSSDIPEIGLHTFGDNSTLIYFDDFAMQAIIEADPIILPPVQE